jgi:tetratricopeptide (TPR) repeat protein
MIWAFLTLLPVLQLVPFHELAADHFEYLPLVGFASVLAAGFSALLKRFTMQLLVWAALVLLIFVLSVRVLDRNKVWKNSETLWEATYLDAPGSYRANTNLGEIYFRRGLEGASIRGGEVEKGLQMTERSIELDPSRAVSWGNLGAMNYTLGQRYREAGDLTRAKSRQDQAVANFEKALSLEPEDPFTQGNLANAYKELGNVYEAEGEFEKALEARQQAVKLYAAALDTQDRRQLVQAIWLGYGGVFIDAGYYDQAIGYLAQYLKAYPDNPTGNYWMGFCHAEIQSYDKAIYYLEKAVRGRPTAESWGKLAFSYDKVGRFDKALKSYQAALRLQPNSSEVHYQVGILYRRLGDEAKARTHLNQALKLDPMAERSVSIKRLLEES